MARETKKTVRRKKEEPREDEEVITQTTVVKDPEVKDVISFLRGASVVWINLALAFTALGAVYSAIVTISGGRIIPWLSSREIRNVVNAEATDIRNDMKSANDAILAKIDKIAKDLHDENVASDGRILSIINSDHCTDYNDRLMRAAEILKQMPDDQASRLNYTSAATEINRIPDCKIINLPQVGVALPPRSVPP